VEKRVWQEDFGRAAGNQTPNSGIPDPHRKDLPEIRASDKVGIITDRNDKYLPQTEALKQSGDSQSYTIKLEGCGDSTAV
jgi:hypothetical protein